MGSLITQDPWLHLSDPPPLSLALPPPFTLHNLSQPQPLLYPPLCPCPLTLLQHVPMPLLSCLAVLNADYAHFLTFPLSSIFLTPPWRCPSLPFTSKSFCHAIFLHIPFTYLFILTSLALSLTHLLTPTYHFIPLSLFPIFSSHLPPKQFWYHPHPLT